MREIQAIVRRLTEGGGTRGGVLATLVKVEGSSYRRPGARLLVEDDGTRTGSISGGCLEEDLLTRMRTVAGTGRAETVVYDTTSENDLVWGVGLGCHGVVRVLLERVTPRPPWAGKLARSLREGRIATLAVVWEAGNPLHLGSHAADDREDWEHAEGVFFDVVEPPPRLAIFGAGDDAQPLAKLAKGLGWHVTVADVRPSHVTPARFPEADRLETGPADHLVSHVAPRPDGLAVVMTHHFLHDVPLLRSLLGRPLAFLGLLGPRKRAERILDQLASEGVTVTPELRSRLSAPVGLDLGADGADEVALSIVAEMQAALAGRDGRPLRERIRPIHDPFGP